MRYLALLMLSGVLASAQSKRPRIAIAGLLHESNTFATTPTAYRDFGVKRGDEMPHEWAQSKNEFGGFMEGCERFGLEPYYTMGAIATPAGPVTRDALDRLTAEMIERLKAAPKLDGILLALHGALVAEGYPEGDAEIVRRLREALGPNLPIVVTHDFHANVAQSVVDRATALLTYKENPHIDMRERGVKAAEVMSRVLHGAKPVQALAKPPMLYNIRFQYTRVEPLLPVVEETRRLEKNPKILAASVSGGYQYADVPNVGPSVIVVTDNDPELAQREAKRLSDMLWATRDKLVLNLPDAAEAVTQAMHADKAPVVLVDMGDNIGGGSAGDSTFVLAELLKQKAQGWVVVIADPEAVKKCAVGQPFDGMVGGKIDKMHGDPVHVRGYVKTLYDGKYIETEIRHGGSRYLDQGMTAVVEVEGGTRDLPNILMLTTKRQTPFSLHQLISAGVYPQRQKILVVKAAIAYRAAYEPIAGKIIEVDTAGATAVNPKRFAWKHARRPLFGLD